MHYLSPDAYKETVTIHSTVQMRMERLRFKVSGKYWPTLVFKSTTPKAVSCGQPINQASLPQFKLPRIQMRLLS